MTVSHTLLKIESAAVLHQEHLAERANRRLLANSIRQQENIEAIAAEAIEHVAEKAARAEIKPVKEEPSADWMEDFIDLCKNTTEGNMRQLWGRVLAGEMQKPGSYSVRALFALKMLLPSEAELFRHASRLVFDGGWIYRGERSAVAAQFGLPFETYVILSSAGLVASESELGASSAIENGGAALLRYGPYMFIIESYENNMPTTPIWSLTAVGKELVQLVDFDPNWEYVKCFAADQRKAGTYLLPVFTPQGMPEPPDLTPPEVAPKTTDRRVNESKNESKRAKPRKRKTQ